jgi:hypothetical protein
VSHSHQYLRRNDRENEIFRNFRNFRIVSFLDLLSSSYRSFVSPLSVC